MLSLHSVRLQLRCRARFGLPYWRRVQCDLFADRLEIRSPPFVRLFGPIDLVIPVAQIALRPVIGAEMRIDGDGLPIAMRGPDRIDVIRLWNRLDAVKNQTKRGAPIWVPSVADQQLWCRTGIFP